MVQEVFSAMHYRGFCLATCWVVAEEEMAGEVSVVAEALAEVDSEVLAAAAVVAEVPVADGNSDLLN